MLFTMVLLVFLLFVGYFVCAIPHASPPVVKLIKQIAGENWSCDPPTPSPSGKPSQKPSLPPRPSTCFPNCGQVDSQCCNTNIKGCHPSGIFTSQDCVDFTECTFGNGQYVCTPCGQPGNMKCCSGNLPCQSPGSYDCNPETNMCEPKQ